MPKEIINPVTISKKRYFYLLEQEAILQTLFEFGVENWSCDIMYKAAEHYDETYKDKPWYTGTFY